MLPNGLMHVLLLPVSGLSSLGPDTHPGRDAFGGVGSCCMSPAARCCLSALSRSSGTNTGHSGTLPMHRAPPQPTYNPHRKLYGIEKLMWCAIPILLPQVASRCFFGRLCPDRTGRRDARISRSKRDRERTVMGFSFLGTYSRDGEGDTPLLYISHTR